MKDRAPNRRMWFKSIIVLLIFFADGLPAFADSYFQRARVRLRYREICNVTADSTGTINMSLTALKRFVDGFRSGLSSTDPVVRRFSVRGLERTLFIYGRIGALPPDEFLARDIRDTIHNLKQHAVFEVTAMLYWQGTNIGLPPRADPPVALRKEMEKLAVLLESYETSNERLRQLALKQAFEIVGLSESEGDVTRPTLGALLTEKELFSDIDPVLAGRIVFRTAEVLARALESNDSSVSAKINHQNIQQSLSRLETYISNNPQTRRFAYESNISYHETEDSFAEVQEPTNEQKASTSNGPTSDLSEDSAERSEKTPATIGPFAVRVNVGKGTFFGLTGALVVKIDREKKVISFSLPRDLLAMVGSEPEMAISKGSLRSITPHGVFYHVPYIAPDEYVFHPLTHLPEIDLSKAVTAIEIWIEPWEDKDGPLAIYRFPEDKRVTERDVTRLHDMTIAEQIGAFSITQSPRSYLSRAYQTCSRTLARLMGRSI